MGRTVVGKVEVVCWPVCCPAHYRTALSPPVGDCELFFRARGLSLIFEFPECGPSVGVFQVELSSLLSSQPPESDEGVTLGAGLLCL